MISSILQLGSVIIDKIFPNKDEALKAKMKLSQLEKNGDLADIEGRWSAMIAESKSSDKWTSRARPFIIYTLCIYLLTAIPLGILYAFIPEIVKHISEGMNLWLIAIPKIVWEVFGAATCVYIGARSFDKRKGVTR